MSIVLVDLQTNSKAELTTSLMKAGYAHLSILDQMSSIQSVLNHCDLNLQSGKHTEGLPERCDLLLVDISQDATTVDLCRQFKNTKTFQDIPIIVFAAEGAPDTVQMAFAYGAHDFVVKPWRESELLARIRSALRLKHEIDSRKARERELTEAAKQLSDLTNLLRGMAMIDALTGIANRRGFDRSLEQEFRRAGRNQHPISLLMCDIDHFKKFNDHYGHLAGDETLKKVSHIIRDELMRPGDLACRFGGEEFAVILPETDIEGAKLVADKICSAIINANIPHAKSTTAPVVTLSIGYSCFKPNSKSKDTKILIAQADEHLYKAKSMGRNQNYGG